MSETQPPIPPPLPNISENESNMDEMIKKLTDQLNTESSGNNINNNPSLLSQLNASSFISGSFGVILGSIIIIYILYSLSKKNSFSNGIAEF